MELSTEIPLEEQNRDTDNGYCTSFTVNIPYPFYHSKESVVHREREDWLIQVLSF